MARSASDREGDGGTQFGDSVLAEGVSAPERFKRQLAAGSVIDGKYRLETLLGEGGMGAVWRAQHLQLELPVAIKLLLAGTESTTLSERLKIEARAAAQLAHPAIVRVFDVDTTDAGDPFIVMELLSGESLSDLLDRGRLTGVSAVQIMLPIAEALVLAHSKGVVHRDLKPHNVFMAQDGDRLQPKLLDFGIAKLTSAPVLAGGLTETGIPIGSPEYMSPEQARGIKDVDSRADIWAFSVVLYEAVTGKTPFRSDNYNALMRAILEDEPAALVLDQNLDQSLAELILWGLAKDRNDRPGSMQELGRELARFLLDRGIKEDVCGQPLGPRWITRTAQKSVPVIVTEETERPKPAPLSPETLVSARLAVPRSKAAASVQAAAAPRKSEPARRYLASGAVALLLVLGLIWALGSRQSTVATPESAATASTVATSPTPPQRAPATAPLEIATTPVAPIAVSTSPLPSAGGNSVSAAPSSSGATKKTRDGRSQVETPKPAPAAQPARDGHDETRELLQAY